MAVIALGIAALLWRPSSTWVEQVYVNGFYPYWQHTLFAASSPLAWSLGDIVVILGVAAILLRLLSRDWLGVLAIIGLYAFWFEAGWGWNYNRAPIETRTVYDTSRVTPRAVDALRAYTIAQMNRLAPSAHARASAPLDLEVLRESWVPVVQAGGNSWEPLTGEPKPTLADPFMVATGTSGYINPLALDVHLASDLLWFERPFALSHEWSHVAGYAREDEANFLAIVSCTRSNDPVVQYSGWLELFLYLPPPQKPYTRKTFVPDVWQDFTAMRERNRRHINLSLANLSWRTYNAYLKTNHVASGLQNYDEVTRLFLGIPRDAAGLPLPRPAGGTP